MGKYYIHNGELYHYGVPGMKWGIRKARKPKPEPHEDYTRAHSKKSVKEMSDNELRARNNRLQAEKQYGELTKKTSAGKKFITAFIATGATVGAVMTAANHFKNASKQLGIDKPIKNATSKLTNKFVNKFGDVVFSEFKKGSMLNL